MGLLRRLVPAITRSRSASAARERLLSDGAMHASRVRRTVTAHQSVLDSIPSPRSVQAPRPHHPGLGAILPPHEQRRRLIEIAACYPRHYLAAVEYLAEQNVTVGTIKPVRPVPGDSSLVLEICIDAHGNVSVSPACGQALSRSALAPGRLVMWLAVLLAAAGAAAYFL
jgi:hypothetical protein